MSILRGKTTLLSFILSVDQGVFPQSFTQFHIKSSESGGKPIVMGGTPLSLYPWMVHGLNPSIFLPALPGLAAELLQFTILLPGGRTGISPCRFGMVETANLHNLCAVQVDFGIYIWVRGKSLNPFQKSISYIYVFFGIDSIS